LNTTAPRLGRGLDALLGGASETAPKEVEIPRIQRNPYQPRKEFDDDQLQQLTDSVKAHGILQPIVVRDAGDHFQLIAGERRLRAATAAGLVKIPVHVVHFDDQQVYEAALVENIQRTDLNPIEKAEGFKDYIDRYQVTHEQMGQKLGIDRASVSNLVGLLNLPKDVQDSVRMGQISLGHAKILKGLSNKELASQLCKLVIVQGMSVQALDAHIKELKAAKDETSSTKPTKAEKTAHVVSVENELRERLAVKVEIKVKAQERGQIVIGFETNDDFERIIDALRK
jgi:ParB family transcriptional regulator, chromosome partitioning protein